MYRQKEEENMYKGAPPLAAVRLYGITITGVSCMCVIQCKYGMEGSAKI